MTVLIISVLSIFPSAGCASLHHRSLESMLIPLKLCRVSQGFVHQAGVEMFMMPLFQEGLTGRCPLLSCPVPSPQLISGQFSFHIAWQPRWYSRSLGPPPQTPNRQSCFQVPLNTGRSGKMTPPLDCSLWYLAAWWLLRPSHFSACPSSTLRFSHEESFTPLIGNFAVPLHFIFLPENLIFSFSYPKVVI